jgi:ribosomal protein S18 acetylase RimI-like enzyme
MNMYFGEFLISDDNNLVQLDRVYEMLSNTYWANNRSQEAIKKSIENSLCFGVYKDNIQIGFARCVTDYAVLYYLCDVTIDEKYRGQGLGKALMKCITEHELLVPLLGLLGTENAQGLYEQFGFKISQGTNMYKWPNPAL